MMNTNDTVFDRTTMGLIIEPLDTLFFRDGRPFGAGDYARGGLPMPQTLYGMIHHHVLKRLGIEDPHDQRHDGAWFRKVAVRGPWLASIGTDRVDDVFIKPPTHLMQAGKDDAAPFRLLAPLHPHVELPGWKSPAWNGQADLRPLIAQEAAGKMQPVSGFLNKTGLQDILNGKVPDREKGFFRCEENSASPYLSESRTGIAIDPASRTVEHGFLYTANHIRLAKGIAFYAEIGAEGDDAEAEQKLDAMFRQGDDVVLSFGGEGRRVLVRRVAPFAWPVGPEVPAHDVGGFTTILLSPGLLHGRETSSSQPWHPPHIATLRAAAVGKPVPVSGWSIGGITLENSHKSGPNVPKPTRYAVDAGTTYFWQNGKHAAPDKVTPHKFQLVHKPILRAAGWGVALRGAWEWKR